jgi:hypothetical protein
MRPEHGQSFLALLIEETGIPVSNYMLKSRY